MKTDPRREKRFEGLLRCEENEKMLYCMLIQDKEEHADGTDPYSGGKTVCCA